MLEISAVYANGKMFIKMTKTIFSIIPSKINATIGERSMPLIGGTIFLQGAKKKLLKSAKNLNGWRYHSMLGNKVKKQLIIKMKKIA